MNIKELMKKYGVLIVIAALFIGAIGYFAYDANKGKVLGKSAGGKDIIASIKGLDFSADDAYEALMNGQYSGYGLYLFYERAVVAASVTPDADMKSSANIQKDQLIAQFKSSYGDKYEATLQAALAGVGLKGEEDLPGYFLHYLMLNKLTQDYVDANASTLLVPYIEENKIRYASHILVKMADPDNPTTEEQAKLDAAKAALAGGMSFADAAKEYSDDGSAALGGTLGMVTKDTSFVEPFLSTTLALGHDEKSDWIKTEFGWHIIHVTEARSEELMKNEEVIASYTKENSELMVRVVADAASKLDIKFADESVQKKLEDFMRISGEE